jgi:hypothetical protein
LEPGGQAFGVERARLCRYGVREVVMTKQIVVLALIFGLGLASASASAHDLTIHPYIQQLHPTSAWILWETDGGTESEVSYGVTEALGSGASGTATTTFGQARVHEVHLTGLLPDTTYHYQVTTGDAVSEVTHFRTPNIAGDEAPLRIVAMSDMQRDGRNPEIFGDLVLEGVVDFLLPRYGSDLSEVLDMVLVPGDLVDNGLFLNQWRDTFFAPIAPLSGQVPVYPVPGNHELDSDFFFKLFNLPRNGTDGFEEHWWWHDVSNLRVIGLDSNGRYRVPVQLDWLDDVLDDACDRAEVDFVFVQLHHPFKSELWLPGETDYTGEVVDRLERFTDRCQKPSVHFFGHTHGYSRGQSRDHTHLWVNVATSGGNIDYWGEYEQRDYDEFTVTQDEYGFVVLDVTAGDDPTLRLRRIGRGDEDNPVQNELRDEIEIRRNNTPPVTPVALHPVDQDHNPDCITLKASAFEDADGDLHGASRWQLARACDGFDAPIFDRWRQHENWFEEVNRQADDDLTDEVVEGLDAGQTYCWRVRYRDRSLGWSAWSEPQPFSTGATSLSGNLVVNGDAEEGTDGWNVVEGFLESVAEGECDSVAPYDGNRLFIVGGNCDSAEYAEVYQSVDVSEWSAQIDNSEIVVQAEGWMRNFNGRDEPAMYARYLDDNDQVLGQSAEVGVDQPRWTLRSIVETPPVGTRVVDVVLTGTRRAGDDNDSYFDAVSLRITEGGEACDDYDPDDPDPDPDPDVGPDTGPDVGVDVDPDEGSEVGPDAEVDLGPEEVGPESEEVGPEIPPEVGTDAAPDADRDTGAEVQPDVPDEVDGDGVRDTGAVQDDARADTGETGTATPPADDGCGCTVQRRPSLLQFWLRR